MNPQALRVHANAIRTLRPRSCGEAARLLEAAADELDRLTPALGWLVTESAYAIEKHGVTADDARTAAGWADGWGTRIGDRLHRADVLLAAGPSEVGVQAVAKLAATAVAALDAYVRACPGVLPAAGHPAG